MKFISIKDYSDREKISTKAVYARAKKGTIISTEKDGKKYIVEEEKDCKKYEVKIAELSKEIQKLKGRISAINKDGISGKSEEEENEIEELKKQLKKVESQKQKVKYKEVEKEVKVESDLYLYIAIFLGILTLVLSVSTYTFYIESRKESSVEKLFKNKTYFADWENQTLYITKQNVVITEVETDKIREYKIEIFH